MLNRKMLFSVVFVGLVLVGIFTSTPKIHADETSAVETNSSEKKRITPAGKLISDASTQKAAVVPMTFDFVRIPDSFGPDGKGRYLLAINSRYGLQFDSRIKASQSISVIDSYCESGRFEQNHLVFRCG